MALGGTTAVTYIWPQLQSEAERKDQPDLAMEMPCVRLITCLSISVRRIGIAGVLQEAIGRLSEECLEAMLGANEDPETDGPLFFHRSFLRTGETALPR